VMGCESEGESESRTEAGADGGRRRLRWYCKLGAQAAYRQANDGKDPNAAEKQRSRGAEEQSRGAEQRSRAEEQSSGAEPTAAHSPESPLPPGPWRTSNPYSSVVRQSPHGWILPSTTPRRAACTMWSAWTRPSL
jgi:hypothetical protein